MKNIKLFLVLCIGLVILPVESYSQVSTVINTARRGISKVVMKKNAKEATQKVVKEGARNIAKNKVKKEATETIVRKGTRAIGEKEAKEAIKQGAETVVMQSVRRSSGSALARFEKVLVNPESKKMSRKLGGLIINSSTDVASKTMTKEVAEEVSEQLIQKMGQNMMKQWRRIVPDATSEANQILLKDISDNPSFSRLICGTMGKRPSPQLLEAYVNCLGAPSVRVRPEVLRYLSSGSDLFHAKGLYRKSIYGTGKDLRLMEKNGVVEVFREGSEKSIGKMIPNNSNGFDIEVPFEDRTLLNLFPMKNSRYSTTRQLGENGYVKNTWVTDEYGRTEEIITVVKPDGKFVPLKRDKNAIQSVGRIKKDNTIHGQTPNRPTYINDDCGHMAALQCGGTNDCINLLPQNASLNKGSWKAGEDAARKSIQEGKTVVRSVKVKYSDRVDLRPSGFSVNQTVNGNQTIMDQFYDNVIELVK